MKITIEEDNIRIDKVLSKYLDYSRTIINKMLDDGSILVNNKIVKPSQKVSKGDYFEVIKEYEKEFTINPQKMDIDIVYEDEDIMVINKESGVVVHPGCGNRENTLANGLLYYADNLSDINGEFRPGIVHRIDKDTSGLMLVAKTNKAHEILTEDFKNHNVKRKYIALLNGVLKNNEIKIDAPIGRDIKNRKKMCVTSKNSKNAITYLKVLKRYDKHTLVELELETGRTHQIRVHMEYIGYPVFNDPVYSHEVISGLGQFLHSKDITFTHPITKKVLYFDSELPTYFLDYLKTLE